MTTSTKQSPRRPEIEADLADRYHVDYTYHESMPTSEFDIDASLKNNARFDALDEATVAIYQEAVERGDVFPAVVASRRGRSANAKLVIIDGNHRLVAHHNAGKPIALYEVARNTKPAVITLMTYTFNTRHGRATSEAERVQQALWLIDNGAGHETAAREVNIPMRILKRELAKANAARRAKEVGVDPREWEYISGASQNRLLNVSTDEGFLGAVHLTYAAKLNSDEVFDLVALLNTTKSAVKQRDILKAETTRFQERAQDQAGGVLNTGGRRTMTAKGRINMVLGHIVALPDDTEAIGALYGEAERREAAKQIMDASRRLQKVAKALTS